MPSAASNQHINVHSVQGYIARTPDGILAADGSANNAHVKVTTGTIYPISITNQKVYLEGPTTSMYRGKAPSIFILDLPKTIANALSHDWSHDYTIGLPNSLLST
jgi:hypothetical protein